LENINKDLLAGPQGAAVQALWREAGLDNSDENPDNLLNNLLGELHLKQHQRQSAREAVRQLSQGQLTEQDWQKLKANHRANKTA
jgi:hypothetical protein